MKYIEEKTIEKLNNYQLLKFATEHFTQLIYFLEQERGYKKINLKIGNFKYDDWEADLYCELNNDGIFFKHIRIFDKKEWKHKSLTENLIYGWGFEETKFNINFEIINTYYDILNEQDKDLYDSLYDEAHAHFW